MGGIGGQGCYFKLGGQGRPSEKVRKRADLQDVRTNQLTSRVCPRQSRQGEYKTQGGRARPAEFAARRPGAGAVWTRGRWQVARPWAFSGLLLLYCYGLFIALSPHWPEHPGGKARLLLCFYILNT